MLALLYDPDPPALTCVEEVDHGLHPQALELLVERLRRRVTERNSSSPRIRLHWPTG
jgi:predicted ATPase